MKIKTYQEETKELKRKLILSAITILMLFISITGVTYAYWNKYIDNQSITHQIGDGDTLYVELNSEDTGVLIPSTETPYADEVTEIVLTYNVRINQEALDSGHENLSVNYENLLINGVDTYNHLINIDINPNNLTVNLNNQVITVTITMNEPLDYNEYIEVINASVTFNLKFEITD
jgi:hypothetical protein